MRGVRSFAEFKSVTHTLQCLENRLEVLGAVEAGFFEMVEQSLCRHKSVTTINQRKLTEPYLCSSGKRVAEIFQTGMIVSLVVLKRYIIIGEVWPKKEKD